MKISAAAADRFVANPDAGITVVLIYGPDDGLVRERAGKLVRAVVEDPSDPFRVAEMTAGTLRDDPARLCDEAASMSLVGGRRVVRLREATDAVADTVKAVLEIPDADSLVVVEAGDLSPRSRLRKLAEESPVAAAVPCYADDDRALENVIRESLGQHGLAPSNDALIYLRENLGGDRMVTRMELEKLGAYAAGSGQVTLEHAVACVGDSAAMTLEDIAFATAAGRQAPLVRALDRAFQEGNEPVRVIRTTARHFLRLQFAAGMMARGESSERAMKSLRPPVFFKRRDDFRRQLERWKPKALADATEALLEAELACKSTGIPTEVTCSRALMRLAARASS